MTYEKSFVAICLAALLTLPVTAIADDHGSHGGSGGGTVSDDPHGDNHGGQGNGNEGDHGGANQNNPGNGAQNGGANNANPQPQRTRVALAATDAGNLIGAEGHADLRAQGTEQRLTIEMEANVPDGIMFNLTANGVPVGAITIELGEGEFEFDSGNGQLAGGLMPSAITSIALSDSSNTVVLQAQFGAITN